MNGILMTLKLKYKLSYGKVILKMEPDKEALNKFHLHAVNCPTCCYEGLIACPEISKIEVYPKPK
jgi:hypothetical protein